MIKAHMTKEDGTPIVVLGLSYKNLWGLQNIDAIIVNMEELGHTGKVIINASDHQHGVLPNLPGVACLNFTDNTIDALKGGHTIILKRDDEDYQGEIFIFAGETELAMQIRLKSFLSTTTTIVGSICEKCETGRRDDGSCDCPETMT